MKHLPQILTLLLFASIGFFLIGRLNSQPTAFLGEPKTHWMNEEAHLENMRLRSIESEERKRIDAFYATNRNPKIWMFYGASAFNFYSTNFAFEIGVSNRYRVEIGFREDGVVVWRAMR